MVVADMYANKLPGASSSETIGTEILTRRTVEIEPREQC